MLVGVLVGGGGTRSDLDAVLVRSDPVKLVVGLNDAVLLREADTEAERDADCSRVKVALGSSLRDREAEGETLPVREDSLLKLGLSDTEEVGVVESVSVRLMDALAPWVAEKDVECDTLTVSDGLAVVVGKYVIECDRLLLSEPLLLFEASPLKLKVPDDEGVIVVESVSVRLMDALASWVAEKDVECDQTGGV